MGVAEQPQLLFAFQQSLPRNVFPSPIQRLSEPCRCHMPRGVTVAIESPFHAQEREPSWGSGSFPEHLPGAVGWTTGMENRHAHM